MSESGWARRREALAPLGGGRVNLVDRLSTRTLRITDVRFGVALGLLDAREAIRVENRRAALGHPQSDLQQRIANALPDEIDQVADWLRPMGDPLMADEKACALWFGISLQLLGERWLRGAGDCRLELVELCAAWGDEGAEGWTVLRPRGIDAFFFGAAARRRLLGRVSGLLRAAQDTQGAF